ncbi:M23 family metallopeptidase [Capillimicrobium parvum]|uniref:M23ase beta-sheet core domain-containing protein n=1 Tax=Capillimicrobium parvum TaxID=2884022 RepID=A0A9E6Y267_9ACTN|nr:M23 family metallopeptidase [Capillimicrobium parvum]UGS38046.1 hypothetical protein DSM104329_04468 [Capillimicrobium parvum]
MNLRRLVPAVIAALSLGSLLSPAAHAAKPAAGPLTPVIASMIPQRQVVAVRGSDGRFHVLYELMLTNSVGAPATLGPVRILDAANGRTVRRLSVKEMLSTGALHQLDRQDSETSKLPAGSSRLLTLDVSFASRAAVPRRLTHRFQVATQNPLTSQAQRFTYDAGRVPVSRRIPPAYAPPLEGTGWVASDGCCSPSGHVNAILGLNGRLQAAERFAIDWMRIDAAGRMFQGDPANPASWFSYGSPIKAVSDGVVTYARDGEPDQTPGRMPTNLTWDQLVGNAVYVRTSDGLTQAFVHLSPGSVRVKAGDRVQTGMVLGLLGNSGASLAPHLHFHVVDGRRPATSDGFPYTITSFSLAGQANVNQLLAGIKGEASFPSRDQLNPVAHDDELPLGFSVVDF